MVYILRKWVVVSGRRVGISSMEHGRQAESLRKCRVVSGDTRVSGSRMKICRVSGQGYLAVTSLGRTRTSIPQNVRRAPVSRRRTGMWLATKEKEPRTWLRQSRSAARMTRKHVQRCRDIGCPTFNVERSFNHLAKDRDHDFSRVSSPR